MPVIISIRPLNRYAPNIKHRQAQDQPSFAYFVLLTLALVCLSLIVLAYNSARGYAAGTDSGNSQKKTKTAKGPKESDAATKARINAT
jgi:hypothetical protein